MLQFLKVRYSSSSIPGWKYTSKTGKSLITSRHLFNLADAAKSLKESTRSASSQKYTIAKKFQCSQPLMYALVSRVDLYHEFIPYCTSSFIKSKDPDTNQPTIAGLRVGFQAFDEEFTCNLECEKPKLVIAKSITHSLFYFLETEWKITPVENGAHCVAVLNLKYEFKSMLYNQVSSLFAKKVASLMTKAFEKRAFEVSNDKLMLEKYDIE